MSDPNTAPKSSRLMRGVLVVSLAANLAFVGMVAGLALRGGPGSDGKGAPRDLAAGGPLARALPQDIRRELGQDLRGFSRQLGLSRNSVKTNMMRLADILSAQPFDAAMLEAELQAQSALVSQMQGKGQSLMLEAVTQMSDAERLDMAENLRCIAERGPQRGGPKPRK